jgi:hypothetical protein
MRLALHNVMERHSLLSLRVIALATALLLPAAGPADATAARASNGHAAPGAAATASARSSPFAGHWEADLQGDGKLFTFLFDFTVRGDSLGGTLGIASREGTVAVRGTVRSNRIHFEQFGLWDGTLEGANLKLSRGLDGGKVQHLSAHRVSKR